jgi:glycerate-2-kinase
MYLSTDPEYIKNVDELLSHGNCQGRTIALDILEYGMKSIDTYDATRSKVALTGDILCIDGYEIDLSHKEHIYILGAGKASYPIARALEDILGDCISGGIIIEKREETLPHIETIRGGHPIPDQYSMEGAQKIVALAEKMTATDLAICAFTGGSSALFALPVPKLTLRHIQETTDLLLKSGAGIEEINAVRKHLSRVKGGRLARIIAPAEIINLTVSDVIGDYDVLDVITCPTVPDTTTFSDAISVLKKYSLWTKIPGPVRAFLQAADPTHETPKQIEGVKMKTIILSTNMNVCQAAQKRAKKLGFHPIILSSMLEGESKDAGIVLAGIAREVCTHHNPISPPAVLISGGETTVTISGTAGKGGPNQEFVLGAALTLAGNDRVVVASLGTDGTDGPTEIAGGLTDGYTVERAQKEGLDIFTHLINHDASRILTALGDAIYTGPTGTNVMDFRLLVILSENMDNEKGTCTEEKEVIV